MMGLLGQWDFDDRMVAGLTHPKAAEPEQGGIFGRVAGLFDEVFKERPKAWIIENLKKSGVDLADLTDAQLARHMQNYREACDRIIELGGTPPTQDELQAADQPYFAVLKKMEFRLQSQKKMRERRQQQQHASEEPASE